VAGDLVPFRYYLRVRYGECDAQKVVFNARFGDYVDLAATEFMRAVWGSLDFLMVQDIDYQLVRQTIEWKGPARFDEVLAVAVETARVGTTSFTLQMELRSHEPGRPGRPVAKAETVYVLVDGTRLEKMPVPDEQRRKLEHGAPGVVIDHAGAGAAARPPG